MPDGTPGAVLSDGTIRRLVESGRVRIEPWDSGMVQPASVDLRLGDSFRVFHNHRAPAIDLSDPPANLTELITVPAGDSFVIHPGEFCLGRTLEEVTMPDDIVARIEGKALAIDTEVPTPDGWKTMGDLEVGDEVFSPRGEPVRIVAATETMLDRECREVSLSGGASVIADIDHEWEVSTNYDRRCGRHRVVTTRELEGHLHEGKGYRYRVDQTRPVQYPECELPIDPYVLGAWIGDGTNSAAHLQPELVSVAMSDERRTASVSNRLRDFGLLGAKRIPDEYLTASVSQRRALLEGLMDTDGYVDAQGRCDVTTIDRGLAEQYCELIAGLGHRPLIATKLATLYGRVCGLRHEVTFTPKQRVFRLPRKRCRQEVMRQFWNEGRSVIGVRPVPSVPVRCIEVASREGTYLVTRKYVPTHNSSLGRLGLIVHATAGFVDPGFSGSLTLEITNLTRIPIVLWPSKPIAQLSFMALDRAAERPYGHPDLGSHYQSQTEATASRYEGGPARKS